MLKQNSNLANQNGRQSLLFRSPLSAFRSSAPAFTLMELMVVIGIVVLLVGLLIPVVSKVRDHANAARTQQIIASLVSAIESYHQEFHAYPGPLPNPAMGPGIASGLGFSNVTGAENLVLGLSGGLTNPTTYDSTKVGAGPRDLTALGKSRSAYVQNLPLSTAGVNYHDDGGTAVDSIIPEYLDGFPSPLPILYLRARVGASTSTAPGGWNAADNGIITSNGIATNGTSQYALNQILGYTATTIGKGAAHGLQTVNTKASMDKKSAKYVYPYDAYPYLLSPSFANTARQADGYILISAGVDRIYGTDDDITNFGSVIP